MTTPAYSTPMLSGVKPPELCCRLLSLRDRKSTRLNSSHSQISYAVFCLKKKKKNQYNPQLYESIHDRYTIMVSIRVVLCRQLASVVNSVGAVHSESVQA